MQEFSLPPVPDVLRRLNEQPREKPVDQPKEQPDKKFHVDTGGPTVIDASVWARAAFCNEIAKLRATAEGARNDQLNKAAFALGQLVAAGHLDRGTVECELRVAAVAIGLDAEEIGPTIRSGLNAGMEKPRGPAEKTAEHRTERIDGTKPAADAPAVVGLKILPAGEFLRGYTPPDYLVRGIVQRRRLYTLTAPTGHAKTAVMLYLSMSVATGMQFCGAETKPGRVLYLAGENPDDIRARMVVQCEQWGQDPDALPIDFADGVGSIELALPGLLERGAYALVVADTLQAYFDREDDNHNIDVLGFARRALRPLTSLPGGPAVIVPAHPIKNAGRENLVPRGGSALLNEVDGNLSCWKDDDLVTIHWQSKYRGPAWDPLYCEVRCVTSERLQDSDGRLVPTVVAKPVTADRLQSLEKQRTELEDRILQDIRDNPMAGQRERARALGVSKSAVQKHVERMRTRRWIEEDGRGLRLTTQGERVLDED